MFLHNGNARQHYLLISDNSLRRMILNEIWFKKNQYYDFFCRTFSDAHVQVNIYIWFQKSMCVAVTFSILRGSKNFTLVLKIVLFETLKIDWIPITKIDTSNISFSNLIHQTYAENSAQPVKVNVSRQGS